MTRFISFFEHLSPAGVAELGRFYSSIARFNVSFIEVRCVSSIAASFRHERESLEQPRFVVTGRVVQGAQCFLTWDFVFGFRNFHKGVTQTVRGASHLVLDD